MKLRQLDRKLLVGVNHQEGEQKKVIELLNGYRIAIVGLEITPADLSSAKRLKLRHNWYFASLKSHFRNRGVGIVALDLLHWKNRKTKRWRLPGFFLVESWAMSINLGHGLMGKKEILHWQTIS